MSRVLVSSLLVSLTSPFLLLACSTGGLAESPRPSAEATTPTLEGTGTRPRVRFEDLLADCYELGRLSRDDVNRYRTIQFSSYDRRSTTGDAPNWFGNSDGFGNEPIPGFEGVLEKEEAGEPGRYLVCDVQGPGAIVRTWTAGMTGTLRVVLDGQPEPLYEGPARRFFDAHSSALLERAAVEITEEQRSAFEQEDADYLPIPFAKSLRVEWIGHVSTLHFYHLEVRRYLDGTVVESFDKERTLKRAKDALVLAADFLRKPKNLLGGSEQTKQFDLAATESFEFLQEDKGILSELRLRLLRTGDIGPDSVDQVARTARQAALRKTLLKIYFDGASRPQVEAPAGDFFAAGPGLPLFESLPFSIDKDGTMHCRFPMPFSKGMRIVLENHGDVKLRYALSATVAPSDETDQRLRFHARWRVDHRLVASGRDVQDLPYAVLIGRGRVVGVACMINNPPPYPGDGATWWGEGDEKVHVDGELRPSFFGTGSEDYFNYSWSRPNLFAHPYCGQTINSGPGTAGRVSDYRFHVVDDIPFSRSLSFALELYSHWKTVDLSYARILYHYSAKGLVDDHRSLHPSDLRIPKVYPGALPKRERLYPGTELSFHAEATGKSVPTIAHELASTGTVRAWRGRRGTRILLRVPVEKPGIYVPKLLLLHSPRGARMQLRIAGKRIPASRRESDGSFSLRTPRAEAMRVVSFAPVTLAPDHVTLEFEFSEAGEFALDYAFFRDGPKPPLKIPHAIEGESLELLGKSKGLHVEVQSLKRDRFSGGAHRWLKSEENGAYCEFRVKVPKPGTYDIRAVLVRSWDYGIWQISLDGKKVLPPIDCLSKDEVRPSKVLDLGRRKLMKDFTLRLQLVGSNKESRAPHYYGGLDCVILLPAQKE